MTYLWAFMPVLFYPSVLFLLSFESVQRHAIYVHAVNWPLFAAYTSPEHYGFEPNSWHTVRLPTSDGTFIGVTHMSSSIPRANRPTILCFHGNAGNRLTRKRRAFAKQVLSLGYDLVTMDYRGYGDSSSVLPPSEDGLNIDARTIWNWLIEQGIDSKDIVIAGHSLGTGVAARLAHRLTLEGKPPRGLLLIAPYTSIPKLLETYRLFKVLPILAPIRKIPYLHKLLLTYLKTQFNTRAIIDQIDCPILLIHALNDWDIISSHSEDLFQAVVTGSVEQEEMDGYGRVKTSKGKTGKKVIHLEAIKGGHNTVMTSPTAAEYLVKLVDGFV